MFLDDHLSDAQIQMRRLDFIIGRFRGNTTIWNEFGDSTRGEDYELIVQWRLDGLHLEEVLVSEKRRVELALSIWSYDLVQQQFVRSRFVALHSEPRASAGQFEGHRLLMAETDRERPWRETYEQGDQGNLIWSTYAPNRNSEGYYKGRETVFFRLDPSEE